MARLSRILRVFVSVSTFGLAFLMCTVSANAQTAPNLNQADIHYQVRPILKGGNATAVRVTLRFTGRREGQTIVYLPNEWAGQTELWRHISSPTVSGGTWTSSTPYQWRITHRPRARITIRYDITSAFEGDPDVANTLRKPFRPIIRPTWFSLVGSTTLARLNVEADTPIRFSWTGLPPRWKAASDLEHSGLTSEGLLASTLIGGKDLTLVPVGDGGTRLAIQGPFANFNANQLATDFAKISQVHRAFWGDGDSRFFTSLAPVKTEGSEKLLLGTGLGADAFAAWVSQNSSRDDALWLLAHEHFHAWLPGQVGGLESGRSEIESYWFSEGFTNFYTVRTLVRAGLWTPQRWVDHWNDEIAAYQTSSARLMPAAATVDKFWSDADVGKLPYQRGALIALVIDQRVRRATNNRKNLDDVMLAMRAKALSGGKFAPTLLIEAVKEISGLDVSSLIQDVARNGQAIDVPDEAWGGCIRVDQITKAAFDVGFDWERTQMSSNVVTGTHNDGAASRAGLRDGMKIKRRVIGKLGDPDTLLGYEVEGAEGKVAILSWYPRGANILTHRLALGPNLGLEASQPEKAQCLSVLGG